MLSIQEVFDRVVTHLRTQGKPSKDVTGSCSYRGINGTSCAVGCLIDDEFYDPELEGHSLPALHQLVPGYAAPNYENQLEINACKGVLEALEKSLGRPVRGSLLEMLKELQNAHDNEAYDDWELRFESVAEAYDLEMPLAT
jgi:hypothetical protein